MSHARAPRGGAAIELVLVTPALVVVLLLVVAVGRLAEARASLDSVARDAARAASLARTPDGGVDAARSVAADPATQSRLGCGSLDVEVDTAAFRPGGTVAVEISCPVAFADLAGLGLPGSTRLHARSVAVIDAFRGAT